MSKNVLVVGAGIGGLSTALRLVKKGYKVTIIEMNNQAGGRLNQIKDNGFTFDTGPSFFSMSYEFEQLAKDCNIKLPFEYYKLDPLYTVNFGMEQKPFHLYTDIQKLSEQFKDMEPDFEAKFNKYLAKSKALFDDTVDIVIKQNFNSILHYIWTLMQVNPVHLPVLIKSFYTHVNQYFTNKQVKQIISLVAFFLGRTPFDTNAIYSLLSYTEFKHDGYHNVKGGMYQITDGLVRELEKENVQFHYNTEIVDFEATDGKLSTLIDNQNRKWKADIFVINSDAAVFRGKVFKRKKYSIENLDKMEWTMGYLTMYIGVNIKIPNVHHHNYYLGNNFDEYAKDVYKNPTTLQKPYYYVNILSKHNKECAPDGSESIFFVCPVPDLRYKPNWDDKEQIAGSILDDFSKRVGVNIKNNIVSKTIYTPIEWQKRFNLHRGSGLGLSHKMTQIGAFRPSNFDEEFANTFYVGASTVPGAGLPMAVISSKLAYERVENYVSGK